MKLLLVDDEERFVQTLTKRLRLRGVQADCVYDCEEAIRRVSVGSYDVALLDVKMPGLGGIELRRRLESIDTELKFVFVTGHASETDLAIGAAEASDYLVKPIHIEELLETVLRVIGEDTAGDES